MVLHSIGSEGKAFITNPPIAITKVTYCKSQYTIANASVYVQPTSAIFAKSLGADCTLYVIADGNAKRDPIVSGEIYSVNVC